ncbi:MarR family transcriptional regulator [Leptobacterium sp. I13]|uniref:MarR family winged helix-turn-helix transcriptional regulator n=1 Tax=Leptobacterium meishanense TaxID=3128904 RepID=UPI0030ECA6FC
MSVELHIKATQKIPLEKKVIIHMMIAENNIKETLSEALKPFDVSVQQFNVLRILRGQKGRPANMFTIQERMVNKMSNTTRLVDKLVAKSFVNRAVCPSNRRKVEINITKKGLDALTKMDTIIDNTEKQLLSSFSNKELEQLNSLLDKFN